MIVNHSCDPADAQARELGSIVFKNIVLKSVFVSGDSNMYAQSSAWYTLPSDTRKNIKEALLMNLGTNPSV